MFKFSRYEKTAFSTEKRAYILVVQVAKKGGLLSGRKKVEALQN
jgi:hypothetical protein